jgi:hypothetical protein
VTTQCEAIDGKQCKIIWHVDDLKILHCNCELVSEVISRHLKVFVKEVPVNMLGTLQTPASKFLFEINSTYPKMLSEDDTNMFHTMVVKLLFLCKKSRLEVQTAVSFLCTHVRSPCTDDYKMLARNIEFLRGTKDMVLTLENDKSHITKWWLDASFAYHSKMISHTGGIMTLGTGAAYATSPQ